MNRKQTLLIAISLVMMLASSVVFAQGVFSPGLNGSPGSTLSIQRVLGILTGLACWLARIALTFAMIAIVIYGFLFFFAQANPTKFSAAKTTFAWGLVGVLVILGTYSIMATVYLAVDPSSSYVRFAPLSCSSGGGGGLPIIP